MTAQPPRAAAAAAALLQARPASTVDIVTPESSGILGGAWQTAAGPMPRHSAAPPRLVTRAAQSVAAAAARAPFPALALAAALLFAAAGALVLDDYGVIPDELVQRHIAIGYADFIAGDDAAVPADYNRFYGVAFELPLLLLERALGLQDSRAVYLLRHALSHLVFIAGGAVGALLAWRLFGSRWLGLLTMLLFLLHPRIYAHSFFNTKDPPFAAAFMLALYLVHRAFRRGTPGAFALGGVAVGLAVNLRVFGLILLPAVLALLALDVWQAADARARRRALLGGGAFAAAALLTIYALHPYYWENPLRMLDMVTASARHPTTITTLFLGETVSSDAVPPHYVPTWFAVTAPPVTLLLGALGAAVVLGRAARRPRAAAAAAALRFQLLLLGCVVLPVLVVIVIQAHVYAGWRQMFFLWAPFSLLAAAGAQWLAGTPAMAGAPAVSPTRGRPAHAAPYTDSARGGSTRTLRRAAVVGAVGLGAVSTVVSMAALHPHEAIYFSPLVQPSSAAAQDFSLGIRDAARRPGLEHLLQHYPDDLLFVPYTPRTAAAILPQAQRRRLLFLLGTHIGVASLDDGGWTPLPPGTKPPVVHQLQAYGGVIAAIRAPARFGDVAAAADAGAFGPPAARAAFDVYLTDTGLIYRKQPCDADDLAAARFFLHVVPVNPADLPDYRAPHGFDNLDLAFEHSSAAAHGVCLAVAPLPAYALEHVRTGQYAPGAGDVWAAEFAVAEAPLGGVRRSTFDVELDGAALTYRKTPCTADDVRQRFFLRVTPVDAADLPDDRGRHGAERLDFDFDFAEHGAFADGGCRARLTLPAWPIARIVTGQRTVSLERAWEVSFVKTRTAHAAR